MSKGATPAPSDHPSRPSIEDERLFFSTVITQAPLDHQSAKRAALSRDKYSCMVTGDHDVSHYISVDDATRTTIDQGPSSVVNTNGCHIFPPSTNRDLGPETEGHLKIAWTGALWAIINGFGQISVLDELDGANIHRLSNILTLSAFIHCLFDGLLLWFEAMPNTSYTYHINSTYPGLRRNFPPTVTFVANGGLPLPDPTYLKLHAAACRVAHLSGAAEYINMFQRDMEKTKVLARDGSSAEMLSFALQTVQIC